MDPTDAARDMSGGQSLLPVPGGECSVWHCVALYCTVLYVFCCGREIGRMDTRDAARDTSGARAYSQFLVERE